MTQKKKGEKEEKEERKSSGWRKRRSREKQFISWIADFSHCSSLSYPERGPGSVSFLVPWPVVRQTPFVCLSLCTKTSPQTGGRRLIWLT